MDYVLLALGITSLFGIFLVMRAFGGGWDRHLKFKRRIRLGISLTLISTFIIIVIETYRALS